MNGIVRKTYLLAVALLTAAIVASPDASGQQTKKDTVYLVSNAHFDTQWSWDVRTSIDKYLRNTLTQNFYLLDNYPDYVFNFEGGVKYAWMKEYYPLEFEKVKDYVKSGRWHISGASWDATDPNIPYPESFFRNILLGQNFYKKEFGVKSTDIFLPDCFGFGYTLPSIAAHCGLIGFSTQKLRWRNNPFYGDAKIPFLYGMWKGVDGSGIMAAMDGRGYTKKFENGDASLDPELIEMAKECTDGKVFRYFGTGDRGGSATIPTLESIEEAINAGKGPVIVKMVTSDALFKTYYPYSSHPELPVYDGELLMDVHGTGCYTSQAAMKHYNRANEILADAAERAAVIADWTGCCEYPSAQFDEAWKRFVWHQFHDDLTGTSLPEAYKYSWNDELLSQTQFARILSYASGKIAERMNTYVSGSPVVVFNSLAYSRTDMVHAYLDADKRPSSVTVIAPDGKKVKSQLLSYSGGKAEIVFAATVPSMSYSVYDVRLSNSAQGKSKVLKAGGNWIENSVYKVTLNADGDIESIIDKRYGKELVEKGRSVRLAVIEGNESFRWPAWEIQKENVERPAAPVDRNVRISVVENGPAVVSLKVEREYGKSRFVQYISLTDGAADDRIDIRTDIDWGQENSILKAEFPLAVSNEEATYDLGLGVIRRGNNTPQAYEVPAQQWADLTDRDGGYGVSIISDYKKGWDKPADNMLRLTLLHSPGVKDRYVYARTQDFGHHTMSYSIIGHKGDWTEAGIPRKADGKNNRLYAFNSGRHKGEFGKTFSMMESLAPGVDVKAFKKAEDGSSYIVRLYETLGQPEENAAVEFRVPVVNAKEVNGIEEYKGKADYSGNKLISDITPYAPRTYSVELAPCGSGIRSSGSKSIKLPYNAAGYTNDDFRNLANIDGKGNSYSYDLLPEVLTDAGTEFRFGKLGYDNVVKCKGDTLSFDTENGKYRMLSLLVASMDKDRDNVAISVGQNRYEFGVPYYSGFYGQWGWLTETGEGYLKSAPVAYIGTHRHNNNTGNESYIYTYMYRIDIPLEKGADSAVLPEDDKIVVFSASLSENIPGEFTPADEFRAVP
ncbi:MAG: alpha-mannosidase [Candidatus Cryptobacteroides sp.]